MAWHTDLTEGGGQHGTSAGGMRIEIGYGDYTILSALDGTVTDDSGHGVTTNLTYIAGGWMICLSSSGAVQGAHITGGCISSQMVPTDHTWGIGWVDFTMDKASTADPCRESYILFGY